MTGGAFSPVGCCRGVKVFDGANGSETVVCPTLLAVCNLLTSASGCVYNGLAGSGKRAVGPVRPAVGGAEWARASQRTCKRKGRR